MAAVKWKSQLMLCAFFDEHLKGAADSRSMLAAVPEIVVVP
jgi:hypothetical protein